MADFGGSRARRMFAAVNRRRIHVGRPTLADRVVVPSLLMDLVLILSAAAVVSMSAQFVVALWPVPSTGQIIGVLIVGYCLGAVRGGLALVLYLGMGLSGLPVFNQGTAGWEHLAGPTGGYLVAFVVAAILAGLCAVRRWDRRFWSNLACSISITAVVYTFGVVHLMMLNGYGIAEALDDGFTPLFFGGALKALVVAILVSYAWRVDIRLHRKAAAAAPRPRTDSLRS